MNKLDLILNDVYGNRLKGKVDIHLEHTVLHQASRVARNIDASKRILIPDLHEGLYKISIYPTLYHPIKQFITIREEQIKRESFTFPIDPAKVTRIDAPSYNDLPAELVQILQKSEIEFCPGLKGEDLYLALDDVRKAGLLNIFNKMRATVFQNGCDVFSYVTCLTRIRGDRFFAKVQPCLRDEVKNSILFDLV